jgi:hypothetical protein
MELEHDGFFTESRKEIIEELLACRGTRSAVGIWSSCLGRGMFMCFVKEVVVDEDEDDVVIIFDENDLSGSGFETHVLYAYEIDKIYKFRMSPNNTLKVQSLGASDQTAL